MRASLTFGRVFGIPIGAHSSWFLVAALVTWSLASGYFPQEYPGWATATYWLVGIVTAVLFFASVLIHELGHSVVALREGVPVRSIVLFIFGGVAQIEREPPTAGAEFRIAIAGPLTSFALAGIFGLLGRVAAVSPVSAAPAVYLGRINLMLALFNLIPGFPLDGGRVLRAVLWQYAGSFRQATRRATSVGQGVAFLFILFGVGQMFFGQFLNGLWIAFIGWFLNNASDATRQQATLQESLAGVTVRDVMTRECPTISGELRLDSLVNQHILGSARRCFFVAEEGGLRGLITLHNIKSVPQDRWDEVTAGQIMTPVNALLWARPDEDVLALLRRMDQADVNQVPVVESGRLAGMITRENLLRYIRLRSELGI
ncbi:MAG: site-2 protease family protein [Anaerolineae bacterium]